MRLERFLPADFLSGDEWMALRQLAFAVRSEAVPRLTLLRLVELGLVKASGGGVELTFRCNEALRLGDR